MQCLPLITDPIVRFVKGLITQHVEFVLFSTNNVTTMNAEMKKLDEASDGVKMHKRKNEMHTLEIPPQVPKWLDEVAKIKIEAERIARNDYGFFNVIARHQVGSSSLETTMKIKSLLEDGLKISWTTDAQKALARVDSKKASTSSSSGGKIGSGFESRDETFNTALKYLQHDHDIRVIALCGIGGVGKTTMMEQLEKVARDTDMFSYILKVVLGKQPQLSHIQKVIAENLKTPLTEGDDESLRAARLRDIFKQHSKEDNQGILVIFDDVWEKFELKGVGLNPLPKNIKLLFTSRYANTCRIIAAQATPALSVLTVNALEEAEACELLCQIAGVSKENDPELYEIGGKIAKICGGLPIAISVIAATLNSQQKPTWRSRLRSLQNASGLRGDADIGKDVDKIIKISYECLKREEDIAVLLLCGLFPEDSNIPVEDLTRYAWGLRLLKEVPTVGDARDEIEACVNYLKEAYFLIDSDKRGCVKMHDIVLEFVKDIVSKGDHASIVEHGNLSRWSNVETNESCKRISLTCKGLKELPECFKCPNLSLLKLTHGPETKFTEGLYKNMEKLEVIAYERMENVLLPLQCSTNLRTLCLDQCSLLCDISSIGDLSNLEVLSLAYNRGIIELPSTIRNLNKLKLLDVTGCSKLVVDDGVLENLVELKELYMRDTRGGIRLTSANAEGLVKCSENLVALEIEFFDKTVVSKDMSFKNLDRFKFSFGCRLTTQWHQNKHTYENALKLVARKRELLESKMYELFEKANVLELQVDDINDLGHGLAGPLHHHRSSFGNLRVLKVSECANLRHLFKVHVANGLRKLESLEISKCPILKTLVDDESSGAEVFKFHALKFLILENLPELVSLCNDVNVIELPELEKLTLLRLSNFISVFQGNESTSSKRNDILARRPLLKNEGNQMDVTSKSLCQNSREIIIKKCHTLLYVIPSHALGQVQNLEVLQISSCRSMKEIFETRGINIDVGYHTNVGEGSGDTGTPMTIPRSTNTTLLELFSLRKLEIVNCRLLENIFTCSTIESLKMLEQLKIERCMAIQVIVKVEHGEHKVASKDVVFGSLKSIYLVDLPNLKGFFMGKNGFQWPILDYVEIYGCPEMTTFTSGESQAPKLKYIHTGLGKHNLECGLNFDWTNRTHEIDHWRGMVRDGFVDADAPTDIIKFLQFPWSFSNLIEVNLSNTPTVNIVKRLMRPRTKTRMYGKRIIFPCMEFHGQKNLEKSYATLTTEEAHDQVVEETNDDLMHTQSNMKISKQKEVSMDQTKRLWKSDWCTTVNLSNLTKVSIEGEKDLEHVFCYCIVGSLKKLQKLHIRKCKRVEVIVKQVQDSETKMNEVVFPHLRSLKLIDLKSLKGFYLGREAFQWPSLVTLEIKSCRQITFFTKGQSTSRKLKVIETGFGSFEIAEDINSFISTKRHKFATSGAGAIQRRLRRG